MDTVARWLWKRLGDRYFVAFLCFEALSALTICAGTVGILALYQRMSHGQWLAIFGFTSLCILVGIGSGTAKVARTHARPLLDWMRGDRGPEGAPEAWRCAVGLPITFISQNAWRPFVLVSVPASIFITVELDLPAYSLPIVFAGSVVSIAYATVLHFFASEIALRPVIQDIAAQLPPEFSGVGTGVSLRWKLLGSLPLINVVTGVVVSGLSTNGRASLSDLGLDVIVAVLVAFTLSLELTLLVIRSILSPVRDLVEATERVKSGDLSARVAAVSGDEIGQLARSFNEMVGGLEERERLREAFGSYVDPDVAERVLSEGELLEGEELEVTVMFVDIQDFTAFAERASARETVALLNGFFGLVVPIVGRHGGHANKFIGDGLLAVFGAPELYRDHAGRALASACEIRDAVERHYGGEVRVGIGLNSGPVSVGSIGGGGRLEFAVIGDTVNVAARAEQATRELGDTILLTEATRCLLEGESARVEPRGEVAFKGKSDPIPVYTPVPVPAAAPQASPA